MKSWKKPELKNLGRFDAITAQIIPVDPGNPINPVNPCLHPKSGGSLLSCIR